MIRRKKKGMSKKSILECVYIIASMGAPEQKWDKSVLYGVMDRIISKHFNNFSPFISLCYFEIDNAFLEEDERKWKLLLECLEELESKKVG